MKGFATLAKVSELGEEVSKALEGREVTATLFEKGGKKVEMTGKIVVSQGGNISVQLKG